MSDTPRQHIGHVDALNLTISLCLCYTLCIVLVRLWIRRGAFGVDDLVVLSATLVTLGHTGSSYAALAFGLGKPWSEISNGGELPKLNAASIAGVVTFIIALYISKIGVLAFLSRITKNKTQLLLYHACYLLVAVLGIISILVVTVGCPSPSGYYWAFFANRRACHSQTTRWQVLTALDIITELGLLLLPIHLVWNLQMPWTKKSVLLIAFYLRLPVICLSLGRNTYTLHLHHQNSDAGLDSAIVTIWLEVQLAYALAASTLSALKSFTESFNSGFGQGFTRGKSEAGSYALSRTGISNASRRSDKHSNHDGGSASPPINIPRDNDDKLPSITKTAPSPSAHPIRLRPDLAGPRSSATATATTISELPNWQYQSYDYSGGVAPSDPVEESREGKR